MNFTVLFQKMRWVGLAVGLLTGVATLQALDSQELGLEPVYKQLHPDRTKVLGADELAAALEKLPGWQVRDGFLYKVYVTPSFRDAMALMTRISYPIDALDHHPEIRNIYGKVYVGFTTYDQGKKITAHDVEAALAVEKASAGLPLRGAAEH